MLDATGRDYPSSFVGKRLALPTYEFWAMRLSGHSNGYLNDRRDHTHTLIHHSVTFLRFGQATIRVRCAHPTPA